MSAHDTPPPAAPPPTSWSACWRSWRACATRRAAARGIWSRTSQPSRRTPSRKPTRWPMRSTVAISTISVTSWATCCCRWCSMRAWPKSRGLCLRRGRTRDQRQDAAPPPARVRRRERRRCRRRDAQLGRDQACRACRQGRAGHLRTGRHLARPAGVATCGEAAVARGQGRFRLARSAAGAGQGSRGAAGAARGVRARRYRGQQGAAAGRARRPAVRLRQPGAPCRHRPGCGAARGQPQVRTPLPRDGSAGRRAGWGAGCDGPGCAGSAVAARQGSRKA